MLIHVDHCHWQSCVISVNPYPGALRHTVTLSGDVTEVNFGKKQPPFRGFCIFCCVSI